MVSARKTTWFIVLVYVKGKVRRERRNVLENAMFASNISHAS